MLLQDPSFSWEFHKLDWVVCRECWMRWIIRVYAPCDRQYREAPLRPLTTCLRNVGCGFAVCLQYDNCFISVRDEAETCPVNGTTPSNQKGSLNKRSNVNMADEWKGWNSAIRRAARAFNSRDSDKNRRDKAQIKCAVTSTSVKRRPMLSSRRYVTSLLLQRVTRWCRTCLKSFVNTQSNIYDFCSNC